MIDLPCDSFLNCMSPREMYSLMEPWGKKVLKGKAGEKAFGEAQNLIKENIRSIKNKR